LSTHDKVSDEFTVPLCRGHQQQLHQAGNEVAWWYNLNINAHEKAKMLRDKSRTNQNPAHDLRGVNDAIDQNKSPAATPR
jgi:hypothetical protein